MSKTQEALKLALEALNSFPAKHLTPFISSARTAIREALAEDSSGTGRPAQPVNLDTVSGFTFSVEGGTFIGDVQMLKWLVEHHSREYWAHMAKRNEEGAR